VKNRKSARQSRRDKKDKLCDLEEKVRQLNTQISGMKTEMASLRSENMYLKREVEISSKLIQSNANLCALYSEARGFAQPKPEPSQPIPKKEPVHSTPTPCGTNPGTLMFNQNNFVGPSLFLLIILFSYGLFMPPISNGGYGFLDKYSGLADTKSELNAPRIISNSENEKESILLNSNVPVSYSLLSDQAKAKNTQKLNNAPDIKVDLKDFLSSSSAHLGRLSL